MNYKSRDEILIQIEKCRSRIEDLKKRGDEACSDYDLLMGYDSNFYLNVVTLPLNHLRSRINDLNNWDIKNRTQGAQISLPL